MSKTMQILVSGKVQGVGFRNFVANHAEALGVRGWVRNLRDSRVEILAELDEDQLIELKTQLEKGPQFSVVENVTVNEVSASLDGDDFSIAADGGEAWSQN